jgi:tRNA (adenine57-N1/adenine58-N1)-methyltransferase
MWSTAREVAAGDTVIIWLTRDQLQPLVVTPGKDLNTKFGNFKQADLVGVPYGSKVPARTGKGFIHVLRPTPELWTLALPHRTQILYLADIAFITSALHIRSGSRVVEAGEFHGFGSWISLFFSWLCEGAVVLARPRSRDLTWNIR